MALVTANGRPVFAGSTISMPLSGAWVGDLVVDGADSMAGACEIVITGGLTFKGTAFRAGAWLDKQRVRVSPGAGGLGKTARAQHYRSTTIKAVLSDLLRAAGEKLSPTADAAILGKSLAAYTQMAAPVGRAISALLGDPRTTRASWRMLPNGTLWVGLEAWADSKLVDPEDYQDLAEAPDLGSMEFGIESPGPAPGQLLGGRKIGLVEYAITDAGVRGRAFFEG